MGGPNLYLKRSGVIEIGAIQTDVIEIDAIETGVIDYWTDISPSLVENYLLLAENP